MSSAFQVEGLLIKIGKKIAVLLMEMPSLLMAEKNRAKFLLMNKAVVTLLIRSFSCDQAAIAHYLFVLSYYIIVKTGGGCFERTEKSFISFR